MISLCLCNARKWTPLVHLRNCRSPYFSDGMFLHVMSTATACQSVFQCKPFKIYWWPICNSAYSFMRLEADWQLPEDISITLSWWVRTQRRKDRGLPVGVRHSSTNINHAYIYRRGKNVKTLLDSSGQHPSHGLKMWQISLFFTDMKKIIVPCL